MQLLYNLFIHLFSVGIKIASLFNPKAKLFVEGRKNIFLNINKDVTSNVYWFHCASLGEFEQGRPVMEELKKRRSDVFILLTFFSPSGYTIRKNYSGADLVMYLPMDTPGNAKKFIELFKPNAAFFVKYEFWYNYLSILKAKNIPTYLISGIFRNDHYFFKWYGAWFLKKLNAITYFFVQNENSLKLLNQKGFKNVLISGDTRFDRVNNIASQAKNIELIPSFKNNQKLVVAGSTWLEDEKLIIHWLTNNKNQKIIIAPHDIKIDNIERLSQQLNQSNITFSLFSENNIKQNSQVLIVDNIGMLSSIYRYGEIAYIGGGFGDGIHNTLEAAVFGIPVVFGPNHKKFNEANELVKFKGGFVITEQQSFNQTLNELLNNEGKRKIAGGICRKYVNENAGATEKILNTFIF